MAHEEFKDKELSLDLLSRHLKSGTLTIFLGSGASSGFGLPGWLKYLNALMAHFNFDALSEDTSTEDLQLAAGEIKKLCGSDHEFFNLLKSKLYENLDTEIRNTSVNVFKNELMISLGALLMGSQRGKVRRVITLNFDSMLEWFLSIFGFSTKVIYRLPELEGSEDVRIYHPNGFLPHPSLNLFDSDFIIFDMDSADERLGTPGELWFEKVRSLLMSSMFLFIGLSPRSVIDRSLSPLFKNVGPLVLKHRPLGIWLLTNPISSNVENTFFSRNIVPLIFADENDIPSFILSICNGANPRNMIF